MELKIFGKSIFEFNKHNNPKSILFIERAMDQLKKSEFIPDFNAWKYDSNNTFISWTDPSEGPLGVNTVSQSIASKLIDTKDNTKVLVSKATPKEIYQAKMLNDKEFKIKVEGKYVDEQIESFKAKLSVMKLEEFERTNSLIEIQSILLRMQNRKKYKKFKDFYDEFPYTTNDKISKLLKEHTQLKLGSITQFLPDMPKEAIDIMKKYNEKNKRTLWKESCILSHCKSKRI